MKGCLPSPVFVIPKICYSNSATVRAVRAMVWQGKGTEGRVKQTWDCNICGKLMRGGVLLSIPTRYWWKITSLEAPGKRQSGTAQKTNCSKIFGRWSRALRREKLVPWKGASWQFLGLGSGESWLHTPFTPSWWMAQPGQADSLLSEGAQHSHSPQSRWQWPCPGWHLVLVNTGRHCLSFTRAFLSMKGLKGL